MLTSLVAEWSHVQNGPHGRRALWLPLLGSATLVVLAVAVMFWPLHASIEKAAHVSYPFRFFSSAVADPMTFVGADPRARLELNGKTQTTHGRQALITSIVLHPIVAVFVAPGDRVKAGQKLIEMDRDEPEAEVRSRKADVLELEASLARVKGMPCAEQRAEAKAELEGAHAAAIGANEQLSRLTSLLNSGSIAPGHQLNALTAARHAAASERAAAAHLDYLLNLPISQEIAEMEARLATAKADLEASQAELEHFTLFAPIDGVISWLDTPVGRANRPGTTTWGQIIDLREIDVCCEVTPEQADCLTNHAHAELVWPVNGGSDWTGRVVFIGSSADAETGLVPVVARFNNAKERLRANISVKIRLYPQSASASGGTPLLSANRIPGG